MSGFWDDKDSVTRTLPFTTIAPFPVSGSKMLSNQLSLPKLPVPSLDESVDRFLRSLRGISTEEEFQRTRALLMDFAKPGGQGELLTKLLQERAAASSTSWLSEWWLQWAYVDYRDPLVLNVSYFFSFDAIPGIAMLERAAQLTLAVAEYKQQFLAGAIPCDTVGGKTPICMDMFKYMFNTVRLPVTSRDQMQIFNYRKYNHVIVSVKGYFYRMEIVHPDGRLFTLEEIHLQLARIWEASRALPENRDSSIGVLTTEHRDTWAVLHQHLEGLSPLNAKSLLEIGSASFVVCLEEQSPRDIATYDHELWHADGRNRFFDKSMHFIVFPDGQAGYLGEHTGMDGTVAMGCVDYACARTRSYARSKLFLPVNHETPLTDASIPNRFRFLEFSLDDTMREGIQRAHRNLVKIVREHSLSPVRFNTFGKETIKTWKVSPDAFFQAAIHMSYYKIWGRMSPCYESAQTRTYGFGRTETGRTATPEMKAFIEAFLDSTGNVTKSTKHELFHVACMRHSAIMKDASAAQGVDRHFVGMRLIAGERNIPLHPVFQDPLFKRSSYWTLSTSNMTSEWFVAGFGAVVPDGYGVCYCVRSHELLFHVSSRNLRSDFFAECMKESLNELAALCESCSA
eukprot:ANDGO_05886.mRNA.1 mitochondrial Carnitine O-acetyltransferase